MRKLALLVASATWRLWGHSWREASVTTTSAGVHELTALSAVAQSELYLGLLRQFSVVLSHVNFVHVPTLLQRRRKRAVAARVTASVFLVLHAEKEGPKKTSLSKRGDRIDRVCVVTRRDLTHQGWRAPSTESLENTHGSSIAGAPSASAHIRASQHTKQQQQSRAKQRRAA